MRAREIEAVGLTFELQCPDGLCIVSDRRMWQHVIMNLVENAVKFTMHEFTRSPTGASAARPSSALSLQAPRVTVRVAQEAGDMLRVEVSDTGPGIAAGDQAFIFGKFAQGRRGFGAQGLGSGLGLHLSEKIIQMLGGKLELVSPLQDGRGAMFKFTVPFTLKPRSVPAPAPAPTPKLRSSRVAPAPADDTMEEATLTKRVRVLIVDDDELNCLIMKQSLEVGFRQTHGVAVESKIVHTAEQALELIDSVCEMQGAFDVIILDQHMETAGGVMKGSELVAILRARKGVPGPQLNALRSNGPVLVMASANTEAEDNALYRAQGADIVWTKPYPRSDTLVRQLAPFVLV